MQNRANVPWEIDEDKDTYDGGYPLSDEQVKAQIESFSVSASSEAVTVTADSVTTESWSI